MLQGTGPERLTFPAHGAGVGLALPVHRPPVLEQ